MLVAGGGDGQVLLFDQSKAVSLLGRDEYMVCVCAYIYNIYDICHIYINMFNPPKDRNVIYHHFNGMFFFVFFSGLVYIYTVFI